MEPTRTVPDRDSPHNGLLIVDKPGRPSAERPTSHDIVAYVRKWSGQRRIGHTGTLDPMASGVLVLCLGRATRLAEYYQGHDKQYLVDIRLGTATDTYDADGEVTGGAPVPQLDVPALEQFLDRFRGEIEQTPPIYSAIKQQGEALHRKARRGESVQLPSRRVTIHRLKLIQFVPCSRIQLRVVCSAGAYMRSLAHDLGLALGSYAHLAGLRREAAGPFRLDQAHTLVEIQQAAETDRLEDLMLPMGAGLDMPALHPDSESLTRLGHGQQVALPNAAWQTNGAPASRRASSQARPESACSDSELIAQAVAPDGSLAGIIRYLGPAESLENGSLWRAAKWFIIS